MYTVLDVREIIKVSSGHVSNEAYGNSGSFNVKSTHYIVVIAEDEYHNRNRFEFYEGYQDKFLGEIQHYGYRGDYDLLVPGDKFIIERTSTYPVVEIITED